MIGTLVVLLPSKSKGGSLVIEHHDEKVSYRGSADRLALVAFYADCHHAVLPVTTGYRAALTYTDLRNRPSRRRSKPSSSCAAAREEPEHHRELADRERHHEERRGLGAQLRREEGERAVGEVCEAADEEEDAE